MKDIPFSPRFVVAVESILLPGATFTCTNHFTMTYQALECFITDKEVKKDLQRQAFKMATGLHHGILGLQTFSEKKPSSRRFLKNRQPLFLTRKEVLSVTAATLCANGKDHIQSGVLRLPFFTLKMWLEQFGLFNLYMDAMAISREKEGLIVRHQHKARHLTRMANEEKIYAPLGGPIMSYDYHCDLKNDAFNCEVSLSNEYSVKMNEAIWNERIMPVAKQILKDSKQMTEMTLFTLVPILSRENAFTAQFAKELAQQTPAIQEAAKKMIRDCYCDRPQELQEIMDQIRGIRPAKLSKAAALKAFFAKHEWIIPVTLGCIVGITAVGVGAGLVLSGVGIFAPGAVAAGFAAYLASNVGLVGMFAAMGGLIGSAFAVAAAEIFGRGKKTAMVASMSSTTQRLSGPFNGAKGLRSSVESESVIASLSEKSSVASVVDAAQSDLVSARSSREMNQ